MERTERFYKIELLLRSRGCISFAALRDELDPTIAAISTLLIALSVTLLVASQLLQREKDR